MQKLEIDVEGGNFIFLNYISMIENMMSFFIQIKSVDQDDLQKDRKSKDRESKDRNIENYLVANRLPMGNRDNSTCP